MKVPFVDLKIQHQAIKAEIDVALRNVMEKTAFIGGEEVKTFEDAFSAYCGTAHCLGCGNGTDAIFLALRALGVGPGDEVITAANSFIASSEGISMAGAKPVFADYEDDTYTISPAAIAAKITSRTRAIIPVHLYGQMADMEAITALAKRHNLLIVEDAAQAHGAELGGKRAGFHGHCATFSFYPGKNLGAYGDAGAVVTNDTAIAQKMRQFANHGSASKYDHVVEGVNSRLDGMQAAVLNVKLPHLERWTEVRRKTAQIYDGLLADADLVLPKVRKDARHVYHLYVVRVKDRDAARAKLSERGVDTGIHYPVALPLLTAYAHLGHKAEDFPNAAANAANLISLPMFGDISEDQARYVAQTVRDVVGKNHR